ncbi:MAG: hypothetical protein WC988_03465 [Patescibacteria group bacterium]
MTRSKSSMNLVPVILIFVLILGAGYLLLKDTLKLPWFRDDNTVEITRLEGFPRAWETQKDVKKVRRVIKSEAELKEFFAYADIVDEASLNAILSKVNFDKEFLLGVTSDTQEETESLIRIKRVEIDKAEKKLNVKIIQYKPDTTCVPEVKSNILVDVVKISKSDNETSFDVTKENRSCN